MQRQLHFSRFVQLSSSIPDMERMQRYSVNKLAESSQLEDISLELKLFDGQASQVEPRQKYRDAAGLPDKLDAARKLTKEIHQATQLKRPLSPKSETFGNPTIGTTFDFDAQRDALEHVLSSHDLQYKDLFFSARGMRRVFFDQHDLWKVLESTLLREVRNRNTGASRKAGVKYLYMGLSIYLQHVGEDNIALTTAFNRFMDVEYHTLDVLSKWQICETFT